MKKFYLLLMLSFLNLYCLYSQDVNYLKYEIIQAGNAKIEKDSCIIFLTNNINQTNVDEYYIFLTPMKENMNLFVVLKDKEKVVIKSNIPGNFDYIIFSRYKQIITLNKINKQ